MSECECCGFVSGGSTAKHRQLLQEVSGMNGWLEEKPTLNKRLAELKAVAEALVEIMPNLEMSYSIKTNQYNKLEELLRAAGYPGEGDD